MCAVVLRAKVGPLTGIVGRITAEYRWNVWPFHLQWLTADGAHERHTAGDQRGKAVDVVLDDHVWSLPLNDRLQLWLAVHGAVNQRLPRRLNELRELLDCWQPKHGSRLADEVDPELTGRRLRPVGRRVVCRWRWRKVDEILDEAHRLQPALPTRLGGEDDGMTAFAQDVADPNAVVGWAVRAFGHEEKSGHRHFLVDADVPRGG